MPNVVKLVQTIWDISPPFTFTIGIGADGSAVTPVDLEANYESVIVASANMSGIPAVTTLGAQVGFDATGTMYVLYDQNDPSTPWVSSGNLPTAGTMAMELTLAKGVRRLRFILSQVAAGCEVAFTVRGLNKAL